MRKFNFLLIILTFVSLALGQFTSLSKSEGSNIYIFDLFVGVTSLYLLWYLLAIKKSFVIPKAFIYLLGFIVVGIFSLWVNSPKYSSQEVLVASFYAVRFVTYVLFTLGVFNLIRLKELSQGVLIYTLVSIGALVAVGGFIQLVVLPDFTTLDASLGWDPHKNRLASTFFDPNFLGAYLVILLVLLETTRQADLKTSATSMFKSPLFTYAIYTIYTLAIFLTFSRSAWLMFAIVIFIYGIAKQPKVLMLSFLVMFLAYYTVPRVQTRLSGTTDPADSAQFRFVSWSNSLNIYMDNPVYGIGYNAMRVAQKDYGYITYDNYLAHSAAGTDSSLLFILTTTGLLGFGLFIMGMVSGLAKKQGHMQYILVILPLLVESQFINSLFYPQILILWLLALALSYL